MSEEWINDLKRRLTKYGGTFIRYTRQGHELWQLDTRTVTFPGTHTSSEHSKHMKQVFTKEVDSAIDKFTKMYPHKITEMNKVKVETSKGLSLNEVEAMKEVVTLFSPLINDEDKIVDDTTTFTEVPKMKNFQCNFCSHTPFSHPQNLGRHMSVYHKDKWVPSRTAKVKAPKKVRIKNKQRGDSIIHRPDDIHSAIQSELSALLTSTKTLNDLVIFLLKDNEELRKGNLRKQKQIDNLSDFLQQKLHDLKLVNP